MNQALVGIHNLLQVDSLIHIVGELGILVELLVTCYDFLDRLIGLYHFCSEDATGKVATLRVMPDDKEKALLKLPMKIGRFKR